MAGPMVVECVNQSLASYGSIGSEAEVSLVAGSAGLCVYPHEL